MPYVAVTGIRYGDENGVVLIEAGEAIKGLPVKVTSDLVEQGLVRKVEAAAAPVEDGKESNDEGDKSSSEVKGDGIAPKTGDGTATAPAKSSTTKKD